MDKLTKKEREKVIFDAFIKVEPNFAGEKVTCNQCDNDPPDFICDNKTGKRLGVELVEWLNEPQTRRSREFDKLEKEINDKISSPILIDYIKYHNVSIFPIEDVFPNKRERQDFIEEFIEFLTNEAVPLLCFNERVFLNNFNRYPILEKFIKNIMICKTKLSPGCEIVRGGSYDQQDAIKAFLGQIEKKFNKNNYMTLKDNLELNELYLVIYYWMALVWNSPYEGPDFDLNDIVEYAKNLLSKKYSFFDKIFLLIALEPEMKVFIIYS